MCTQYTNTTNAFQINQQQQACRTDKYENAHTQALTIEFSRRRDHAPSTLRIFCRLKIYIKGPEKTDNRQSKFNQPCVKLSVNETVVVVIRIVNGCVEQAVIVASVKCEQWHKNSENNRESLIGKCHIFVIIWFAVNELIFQMFLNK